MYLRGLASALKVGRGLVGRVGHPSAGHVYGKSLAGAGKADGPQGQAFSFFSDPSPIVGLSHE